MCGCCFLYVNVKLGYIGNAENAVLVNIVFPSGCHRVLIFVRLRCLYDGLARAIRCRVCLRNTIGQHRVSIVLPSCGKS